ncbi:MAG: hypothetical protein HQL69_23845, partial [Magnetococcales bacterium]|nr:hypothetical protein [Magnetococcales bacterium]
YDYQGSAIWKLPIASEAIGVNISANKKVVVAAHADGTIRWYTFSQGRHFLSLFPHRDKKRWIVWTPDNYFAASPAGEGLIGWHQNNGPEKTAKFISAAEVRNKYFRPDVIKALFGG